MALSGRSNPLALAVSLQGSQAMTQSYDKAKVLRMADDLHGLANYHRGVRNFADAKVLDQADAMLRAYAEVVEVTDAMAYKVGDEYFRLCKESGDKPMPHAFWSAHLRAALSAALSTRGGDNG